MKYAHVIDYVARTPWAIAPDKLSELLGVLAFRASGQEFSADEIRARIGGDAAAPATSTKRGAIAIVPIRGVIAHRMGSMDESSGGTSAERLSTIIKAVAADESVGTIVYDVDTPGGTVPGVQELAAQIFALRGVKKQIAVANAQMCSAGYWLASQADELVGIPSATSIGSIGVISAHQDLSAALEQQGVKVTIISAGKFKAEGNPFQPLSADALAVRQASVDEAYAQFVKDVARGRDVTPAAVRTGFGEGRALSAKDAKAVGLIDRIATMDDVLGRLTGQYASRTGAGMRAETEDDELQANAAAMTAADADRARRLRLE